MVTKSTRAAFTSLVHEMAGLIETNDVAAELRPARIKRDVADLEKVMKQIEESCNPFEMDEEIASSTDKLFNINTGKAASHEVRASLLNIQYDGRKRHQEFLDSSIANASRFEEKLTKAKLMTFSGDSVRNRK